jgi:transposase, IS5 family
MRPKQPAAEPQDDLFRAWLQSLVDPRHALVRLAGLIAWERFETAFGPLYTDASGRPGLPTRLMVGLHLLKHMDGLSDEAVCARYLDSPYVQLFCGEAYFQHALPLDRSSMTRWRQRIGPERLELLLAESLAAAQRGGAVAERHLRRVTIDTTVQPKAVTYPTDSKLLHRGIEILARLARRHGIRLRQSYLRVARRARREAAKLIHRAVPGRPSVRSGSCAPGSAAWPATSAARSRTTPPSGPPLPGRSGASPACCGSGARTAAATSSTPCTRPRWSASAKARPRPAPSSA